MLDPMTRDIAGDVAAILHPLPTPSPEEYADSPDVYDTWREDAAEEQQRLAEQLRRGTEDGEADPLLTALENELAAKQEAEANIRRLLAYGREFVRPRGYTLESLARAAGMSFSGVRTAYDDHEVGQVADRLGVTKPRDRGAGPGPRCPQCRHWPWTGSHGEAGCFATGGSNPPVPCGCTYAASLAAGRVVLDEAASIRPVDVAPLSKANRGRTDVADQGAGDRG